MSDRILNKREAAALAGFSTRTLERLDEQGDGPPRVRLGNLSPLAFELRWRALGVCA